ncbi:DUF305 domain-containing protein [Novosphingobium flavum]|uniref:DUF305 domain-containing protein n=1 Tax=Novosphingobium flavum TaxID=1778672 RepID=A0A7X1KLY4_9SPHN|nr:DUF305 domain-containing protein [Novosphingobium flavum]MBC2665730.1 DUF305 domain-containing protein [Novosphingobium flavum]
MPTTDQPGSMGWSRLAAMIVVSTAVMFILMYQLVYSTDHAYFSLNRFLSALIMGGVMTAIMLGFMWDMYHPRAIKVAVLWSGIAVAAILLVLNRTQALVDDTAFMNAMIPHHSIAINNARKASISDPRVRKLADEIIAGQVREIEEMKILTADIKRHGPRGSAPLPPIPATVTPAMSAEIAQSVQ